MDAHLVIARNFPWSGLYNEASFSGQLYEDATWSWDEYWLLEWALYLLHDELPSRDLYWPIFRIFSSCFLLLGAHCDPNDGYEISNFNREEFHDAMERFQLVFEGFFKGAMPEQDIFDQRNPLLTLPSH